MTETLARSERRDDPDEEGIRILLAAAWSASPRPDLADFLERAFAIAPNLRRFDPRVVSAVARDMNLPGIGGA